MGAGQGGCCSGDSKKKEDELLKEERNMMTKDSNKPFFKRAPSALHITEGESLDISNFYGNIMVSCCGRDPCSSKFSRLILKVIQNNTNVYDDDDRKQQNMWSDDDKMTIRGTMITLRKYFLTLLQVTENATKYEALYNHLNVQSYKANDEKAAFILDQFVNIIIKKDEYLLQCLANYTCTFKERPLWTEIQENVADNDDLHEQTILDKVEEVAKTSFYIEMTKAGVILTENEILAVYIYTVNTEFANMMQKQLKIPCKWKQTFYYLVRAILKIYDFKVYKKNIKDLPNRLYHPLFGHVHCETPLQILSPINCTASENSAKEGAPPDGTYFIFEKAAKALSEGEIIAAPLNWISPSPEEEEWVILPLTVLKCGKLETFEDECKQIKIKKYQSFNLTLYGVDIFTKCAQLKVVQDLAQ